MLHYPPSDHGSPFSNILILFSQSNNLHDKTAAFAKTLASLRFIFASGRMAFAWLKLLYPFVRALWLINLTGSSLLFGLPNSKVCFRWNLPPLVDSRDIINILLIPFSRSLLKFTEPRFLSLGFMAHAPCTWAMNLSGKTRSVTSSTDLELC